jgi:hypothetical protein
METILLNNRTVHVMVRVEETKWGIPIPEIFESS